MCAVMALVAFVPLVAGGEYTIIKGPQGPRASAMTWTYEPVDYGVWVAKLDNNGLRSLVIDVYDNTSGALDQVLHQRIRFAAYDIYPSGTMFSEPVNMAAGRIYEITATPNGPQESYVVVTDTFTINSPPVAQFTATPDYLTVNVDASASYDTDGTIVEYIWEWGDDTMGAGMITSHTYAMAGTYTVILTVVDNMGASGATMQDVTVYERPNDIPIAAFTAMVTELVVDVDASGSTDDSMIVAYAWSWGDGSADEMFVTPIASHTYAMPGTYTITLTVTDDDGATNSASQDVMPYVTVDNPPVASFTVSVDGLTVSVDASLSTDDNGIVTYDWNWGDGTTGSGMTATHTYSTGGSMAAVIESLISIDATAPLPPYYVAGYTLDTMGMIVPGCTLTIVDMRTLESIVTTSDASGFYMVDIANGLPSGMLVGDLVNITAVKGDMIGWTEGNLLAGSYTALDVILSAPQLPPFDVVITLTVTDAKGQTDTVSMTVTLYP
ncbi:MAG: hypothetical protein A3K76_03630 [Euryarchaeota archaeon RBG_13_57_23]|nr:MAG: hypothetical protein A3K76_03630 [Euryarchaeota archaeon RBG_13_57_23]